MGDKITRSLLVKLTEEEVKQRAAELARMTASQAQLEDEKKSTVSGLKGKLDRCIADCRDYAERVTNKREFRDVDCEWSPTPTGKMILMRLDTQEIIETRRMTGEEQQIHLPLKETGRTKE